MFGQVGCSGLNIDPIKSCACWDPVLKKAIPLECPPPRVNETGVEVPYFPTLRIEDAYGHQGFTWNVQHHAQFLSILDGFGR
jgi:hypothetical protein